MQTHVKRMKSSARDLRLEKDRFRASRRHFPPRKLIESLSKSLDPLLSNTVLFFSSTRGWENVCRCRNENFDEPIRSDSKHEKEKSGVDFEILVDFN